MVSPEKSSATISSRISWRPEAAGRSSRPSALAASTCACARVPEQPVEAVDLEREEGWELEGLSDLGEGERARAVGGLGRVRETAKSGPPRALTVGVVRRPHPHGHEKAEGSAK